MNKAQELQEKRLIMSSFNELDGLFVAQELRENENLWLGYVFGRFEYFDLIELRDIKEGAINADTLMILTTKDKLADLLILINGWSADEISYETNKDEKLNMRMGGGIGENDIVVRVWWD